MNKFITGDAAQYLKSVGAEFVDLTVTSPPYDNLRDYNGYKFDAKSMLLSILKATKPGGVCVWIVGERINGGRSLSSFEHALIGRDVGWTVHDVMIYQKKNTPFMRSNAYTNCYELMLVFSKGKPKTFNRLTEPTKRNGWETAVYGKGTDGDNSKRRAVELKKQKTRINIWQYAVGLGGTTSDKVAFQHPAVFPENLARDHILSWSNPGDLVLDPMCGSGTTCKMAQATRRNWIGIDISEEYIRIAKRRLASVALELELELEGGTVP